MLDFITLFCIPIPSAFTKKKLSCFLTFPPRPLSRGLLFFFLLFARSVPQRRYLFASSPPNTPSHLYDLLKQTLCLSFSSSAKARSLLPVPSVRASNPPSPTAASVHHYIVCSACVFKTSARWRSRECVIFRHFYFDFPSSSSSSSFAVETFVRSVDHSSVV